MIPVCRDIAAVMLGRGRERRSPRSSTNETVETRWSEWPIAPSTTSRWRTCSRARWRQFAITRSDRPPGPTQSTLATRRTHGTGPPRGTPGDGHVIIYPPVAHIDAENTASSGVCHPFFILRHEWRWETSTENLTADKSQMRASLCHSRGPSMAHIFTHVS